MRNRTIKIYSDGGARGNPGPAASAFVAIDAGRIIFRESKYIGKSTNNEAEYNALLLALKWLVGNKNVFEKNRVEFYLDSELVVKQMEGLYKVKSANLKPLFNQTKILLEKLGCKFEFFAVAREKNKLADALVNKKLDENS